MLHVNFVFLPAANVTVMCSSVNATRGTSGVVSAVLSGSMAGSTAPHVSNKRAAI